MSRRGTGGITNLVQRRRWREADARAVVARYRPSRCDSANERAERAWRSSQPLCWKERWAFPRADASDALS